MSQPTDGGSTHATRSLSQRLSGCRADTDQPAGRAQCRPGRHHSGATRIGTTVTNAEGFWNLDSTPLADGSYSVRATATDAAGNVAPWSASPSFNVDAHAPVAPTVVSTLGSNGNQPMFVVPARATGLGLGSPPLA